MKNLSMKFSPFMISTITVIGYFCFSALLLTIGVYGYSIALESENLGQPNSKLWATKAGYTFREWNWFMVGTFFIPGGFMLLLIFIVQFAKGALNNWIKIIWMYVLFGLSIWCSIASANLSIETLQCGVFCFNNYKSTIKTTTVAQLFIGYYYLFMSISILALSTYALFCLHYRQIYSNIQPNAKQNIQKLINKSRSTIHPYKIITALFLTFVVFFPFMVFSTMALPIRWKDMSFAKIQAYEANRNPKNGMYWRITVNDTLVLKLFPDVLFYYGYIYLILIITILSYYFPIVKRGLRMRSKYFLFFGCSVGELFLFISMMGLLIGIFCYNFVYLNQVVSVLSTDIKVVAEDAALAVGHTMNLTVGLLLLPITRNSIWTVIFGVSSANTLKFHAFLGKFF